MHPERDETDRPNPFIEFAESADMGVEVHVLPATPLPARDVVREVPSILPIRHRRRPDLWTGAGITAVFALLLLGLGLAVWGAS